MSMRNLRYSEAMFEGFNQILEKDPDVFIIGQGLWSPWYVGATMTDLEKTYGKERILDSPISENATTGIAIGAAIAGKKAIVVHPRMDFMLLAMDPLVNQASNWSYLFNSEASVPLVVRSIINRGGEQGAQHSQALQSFFMHVPGIKVVMPATAADAKGLLYGAVLDNNPVMFIDDRWCYETEGEVPENLEPIPLGKAEVIREGTDISIIAYSYMVHEALESAEILKNQGISAEVINLRTIKPWDHTTVINSIRKTRRAIVTDTGWVEGGVAAEIAAKINGEIFGDLDAPVLRVGLPNSPAPCARTLEEVYYPKSRTITEAVNISMGSLDLKDIKTLTNEVPGQIVY
jgi:acetoin:2,6-dichlorophenolindophenol oxidoreductase subunit beta